MLSLHAANESQLDCADAQADLSEHVNCRICLSGLNMNLTIPNLVPQRSFCYLNFISVAKPQTFGNETYDAHVLASTKTYRKENKPKKWIPNPLRYMSF